MSPRARKVVPLVLAALFMVSLGSVFVQAPSAPVAIAIFAPGGSPLQGVNVTQATMYRLNATGAPVGAPIDLVVGRLPSGLASGALQSTQAFPQSATFELAVVVGGVPELGTVDLASAALSNGYWVVAVTLHPGA